jgi:mRNA-degrading endonuclease RelE of RelBE toxin-antitoxin system
MARYVVIFEEAAAEDLGGVRRFDARRILDAVEAELATRPNAPSRRKKLLFGLSPPWDAVRPVWQLRVGEWRIFYDVDQECREVVVRAVRRKGSKKTEEIL